MRTINVPPATPSPASSDAARVPELAAPWPAILSTLGRASLRPVQAAAIEAGVLESGPNLIVAAPTNAGKSLVGTLALLQSAASGKRAVLLEPLRVLAHEKADALSEQAAALSEALGVDVRVAITTGEYRTDHETLFASPPAGDIIVATPERLDALLRASEYGPWVDQIGTVVVDEAHMLADAHRGPTLEFLLTALRARPAAPRLVLLSATLGDTAPLEAWLAPATTVSVTQRPSPLALSVIELDGNEDPDDAVMDWVRAALTEDGTQVVVFVYQTAAAESLAATLQEHLPDMTGEAGALAYHAKLGRDDKHRIRDEFLSGSSRVVCATSALAMGVNLPASHVLVRDTTFFGNGGKTLSASELAQMLGRAGRGDAAGTAAVLVRPGDDRDGPRLARALADPTPPPVRSALTGLTDRDPSREAAVLAPLLLRHADTGQSEEELEAFLAASLAGPDLLPQLPESLRWMRQQGAVWTDDTGRVRLTALAEEAVRAVLPLPVAMGVGRLVRDLLTLDPEDELLSTWRPLDTLLLFDLLSDLTPRVHRPGVRRFSRALEQTVEAWVEEHPGDVPVLFRDWMRGAQGHSRARQVFGSLGLPSPSQGNDPDEKARRHAYRAMFRVAVLDARARGTSVEDVERRLGTALPEGSEESWRDNLIWLLSGLGRILEIRVVYHHLKELDASPARIRRVKRALRSIQRQTYILREQLAYLSPLGPLVQDIRRLDASAGPSLGSASLRRLEQAGIRSLADLVPLDLRGLADLGLQPRQAQQVHRYVRRRLV